MIGIDGHVLFLSPKKKKKKVGLARTCRTLLSTLGGLGDRAPPQPNLPAAPGAEAAGAQAAASMQRQRPAAALRINTTNIMTLAKTQPGSADWAHEWTAVHASALRKGCVTARRPLHGRLFVGAFLMHVGTGI